MENYTEGERQRAANQICIGGEEEGKDFFARHPHLGYNVALQTQCDLNRANDLLRIVKNATFTPSRLFKEVSEFLDTQKEEV